MLSPQQHPATPGMALPALRARGLLWLSGNWECLGPWEGWKGRCPCTGCSRRGAALPAPIPGMHRASSSPGDLHALELYLLKIWADLHVAGRGEEGSFCGKMLWAWQEGNSPSAATIARGLPRQLQGLQK